MPTVETPHTNLNKWTATNHSHSIHSHSLTFKYVTIFEHVKSERKSNQRLDYIFVSCETNQLGIWIRLSVVCDMAYGLAFYGTVLAFSQILSCDMNSFHLFHVSGLIWFFVCFFVTACNSWSDATLSQITVNGFLFLSLLLWYPGLWMLLTWFLGGFWK